MEEKTLSNDTRSSHSVGITEMSADYVVYGPFGFLQLPYEPNSPVFHQIYARNIKG